MSLRRMLLACLLAGGLGCAMAAPPERTPPAAWVVDPAAPGDNLPAVGRSLFDAVFAVQRDGRAEYDIPFPFAALLARLDAQLVHAPANPLPPAKRVLIPLGRSLQRTAAAPDYFAFPRVVVAVDGEPANATAPYLKDRLYLGYQEKSAVLEVISYNEAAGRFEYQLVKDYRAGAKPRVFYANRTLCFACHQNGAPIFSRALWDETNANPRTAELLAASRHNFYGIPPGRGIDIPYAIDNATERANGFALSQKLWREGCGGDNGEARRCRADLYLAALRHALSGGQQQTAEPAFAAALRAEARRRWPGGLRLGNPDLPNRNPLPESGEWPGEADARIARSHVAAAFDPLLPRAPQRTWRAEASDAMAGATAGLAEFISAAERRQLDTALGRASGVTSSHHALRCRSESTRRQLDCRTAEGSPGSLLAGRLDGDGDGGSLSRLTLPDGTALNRLDLRPEGRRFALRRAGGTARTASGDALAGLTLTAAEATLEIRHDFALVERAVTALLDNPDSARLFGPAPFPRLALSAALLGRLGGKPTDPCCLAATTLPPPQLETPAAEPGRPAGDTAAAGTQAFYPYCAACHQSAETFPPNFLSGSPGEVATKLRQCAPRLYVRLAMADVAPDKRDKTPMPPESLLPAFATDAAGWRGSRTRQALLAEVGGWLQAETGRPPELTQLLARGYEALRPCLPAP